MNWKLKFVYFPIVTILVGSFLLIGFYDVNLGIDFRSFAFFMGGASGELAGSDSNPIVIITVDINKILGFGRYGVAKETISVFDPDGKEVYFTVSSLPPELTGRNSLVLFAYPDPKNVYGEWSVKIEIFDLDTGNIVNVMILTFILR